MTTIGLPQVWISLYLRRRRSLTSRGGAFDAPAIDSVEIGQDETAAFRDRIETCARLPHTTSPGDNIRIVLRVAFMPDGTLASEPMLIEGSPSAKGLALKQSAVQALRWCQPYAMLPSAHTRNCISRCVFPVPARAVCGIKAHDQAARTCC
jgi:hypothetical protein